jgi:hypothetical protein
MGVHVLWHVVFVAAVDERLEQLTEQLGADPVQSQLNLGLHERKYPSLPDTKSDADAQQHTEAEVDVRVATRRAPKQISEAWKASLQVQPRLHDLLLPHLQSQLPFSSTTPPPALAVGAAGTSNSALLASEWFGGGAAGTYGSATGSSRSNASRVAAALSSVDAAYRPTFATGTCNSAFVTGFF